MSKGVKITQDEFKRRAKEALKGQLDYDFSETKYTNQVTKVKLVCPKHGVFYKNPVSVYKGRGCEKCNYENIGQITGKGTQDFFIEKAKQKHGDKYDYSKSFYKSSGQKLCIICPKHGEFWQTASLHLYGKGCYRCGRERTANKLKNNAEYFIEKAIAIHGYKYDYSKVKYLNSKTYIAIVCKKHGEFRQVPARHLQGAGCRQCYNERAGNKRFSTLYDFIKAASQVHCNVYDYSLVKYKKLRDKIDIICPVHGVFKMRAEFHLNGGSCRKCFYEQSCLSLQEFLTKAKSKHGDKYDYSKVVFKKTTDKITIFCPKHGFFAKTVAAHIYTGLGCPSCGGKIETEIEFIKQAKGVHANKYDYSKCNYRGLSSSITIVCPNHGKFIQRSSSHLKGAGCPRCARDNSMVSRDEFIERASICHMDKYCYDKVILNGITNKVAIICPNHGIFYQSPGSHLCGAGCPYCYTKNESIVFEIIKKHFKSWIISRRKRVNIEYGGEKHRRYFDFWLTKNGVKAVIEYDGQQHFRPVTFGSMAKDKAEKQFKLQRIIDQADNEYCNKNGIFLYRIKYSKSKLKAVLQLRNILDKMICN